MEAANDNYISNEEYHNGTPGISASGLIQIARSPAHYKHWKEHPPEPTAAQIRGSAIHAAILEPAIFAREYVALDDTAICDDIGGERPRSTKAYKEWKSEWLADNADKRIISQEDYDTAVKIAAKAYTHPKVAEMLTASGEVEGTLRWTDEATGVQLKARPDKRLAMELLDVKTTTDARPDAFTQAVSKFGYYLQAAVYREGVRAVHGQRNMPFMFIAIETDEPYGIAVYGLDETYGELGNLEFRRCVELYARCLEADHWPDYPTDIMPLTAPTWFVERVVNGR